MTNNKIHREYKDRLFTFLFGQNENRSWTLSLYNAVNNTDYRNPDEVQINTIKEVLYLGMHNDVSFLILEEMNLFEQQSSFNPNMPLRQMQYASNLFEKYIKEHKYNKYGSSLIRLPVPKLITFYNGTEDKPDEMILELKDSFPQGAKPDIAVKVRMININYDKNQRLLDACRPLKEYSWLIAEIRSILHDMNIEQAVDEAIKAMPDKFEIKSFLDAHRMEVRAMLLTEYNETETMELFRMEGFEKGHIEGVEEGRLQICYEDYCNKELSAEKAAAKLHLPTAESFLEACRSQGWPVENR